MRYLLILLFVLLAAGAAHAQYYNTGTESAAVKWRQIKTDKFTLIYPQAADSLAQRYAWLFDRSYEAVAAPLQAQLMRTPVVLHPYNVYSNGVVVWAPKRMELFTTPPTSGYAQMWDKQLVVHETRHVAQMNKLHHGFFKYLHYFIGEQSEGLASGIYLHNWFLEGDAVVAETALSRTGRGRQPEFLMPIKAFLLSGKKFSWDQWNSGSYRYHPPTSYQIGYLLSAYAYQKAGPHIFGGMLDYITHRPLEIPPGSYGLKKYGGFTEHQLFANAFKQAEQQWKQDDRRERADSALRQLAFPKEEPYRAYRSVVAVDSNTVVAVRTDLKAPRRLVAVDSKGEERFLKYVGQINSTIKRQGDCLYWTVAVPHERWEQVSFSVLQSYNLRTNKMRRLTSRTRYFAPAPSPDGQCIAVVESTPEGAHFVVLLSAADYRPQQRIYVEPGNVPKEMTWSEKADKLYCSVLSDDGICIRQFDIAGHTWEPLLPNGTAGINRLTTYKDYVLFESGYNGTNNIYALDTHSREVFRLTDVRFGAFDPAVSADSSRLLFANYVVAGYTIAAVPLADSLWTRVAFDTPERFAPAEALSALAGFSIDTVQVPSQPVYESTRYSRLAHLFRIHSWAPFYYNPDALMNAALDKDIFSHVGLGATLLSQNTLGSLTSRLGYKYSNSFHSGHLTFSYRGWYPVVDFTLDVNERHRREYRIDTLNNYIRQFVAETGQPYVSSSLRLYIPWNLTRGAWSTSFVPQAEYHVSNDWYRSFDPDSPYYGHYKHHHYIRAGFTLSSRLALATRDIFPRWGYAVRFLYSTAVASRDIFHAVTSIQASLYTPGLFTNQGLLVSAGYQQRDESSVFKHMTFSHLSFPRGYATYATQTLATASADYTFPIVYPDVSLSWVFYIKRLRMTVFGDYAQAKYSATFRQHLVSVGADLIADYHLFRFSLPLSTGIRYAQPLVSEHSPSVSLLFNVSL